MSRPKAPVPDYKLTIYLPRATYEQARDYLFSPLERRIPHGRWKQFITDLIGGFFAEETLDLAPYIDGLPSGIYLVRGKKSVIDELKEKLEG